VRAITEKCPKLEARLLAHVLSHEICHVLQRTNVHAETGLMKARWRNEDYRLMIEKPLPFTPADLQMMQEGLAFYRSRTEID
jgi:predicted SprT family Zn-dependent metalloprotease